MDRLRKCVIVVMENKIFTPDYGLISKKTFNLRFSKYLWDTTGCSYRVKPFRFVLENNICEKVSYSYSDPKDFYGKIVKDDRHSSINIYKAIEVNQTPDDVSPFLNYLKSQLTEIEIKYVISYMAAISQHRGKIFRWAPVFYGTGRKLCAEITEKTVGREYPFLYGDYSPRKHYDKLLFNRIFLYLDTNKITEKNVFRFKSMIKLERRAAYNHYSDFERKESFTNFIFSTEDPKAGEKLKNDFYLVPFRASGPVSTIWDVYDWLERDGGYEAMAYYLNNYEIEDDFNPATGCINGECVKRR